MIENKILQNFKKVIKQNNLIIMFDKEIWEEEHSCIIEEKEDNGKVWQVECDKNGKILEYCEV